MAIGGRYFATDADFGATLEVTAEAGYDSAYTFIFSPRPGTEAATMADRFVDPDASCGLTEGERRFLLGRLGVFGVHLGRDGRKIAADLIREAALEGVRDELPHSLAVVIDEVNEREGRDDLIDVHAILYVDFQCPHCATFSRVVVRTGMS